MTGLYLFVWSYFHGRKPVSGGRLLRENALERDEEKWNLAFHLGQSFYGFLSWCKIPRPPGDPLLYSVILAALIGPIILSVVSLLVTSLAVSGARFFSSGMSKMLNPLTWAQVRKAAFGNDTLGELSEDAGHSASWAQVISVVLPLELGKEITDISNASAADAVEKFRAGMNRLLLSDKNESKEFFFTEYITWDELIHTRYFDSPRFCMLLAYAMAQMPAFRGNINFRDHPERTLISRWYGEIIAAAISRETRPPYLP